MNMYNIARFCFIICVVFVAGCCGVRQVCGAGDVQLSTTNRPLLGWCRAMRPLPIQRSARKTDGRNRFADPRFDPFYFEDGRHESELEAHNSRVEREKTKLDLSYCIKCMSPVYNLRAHLREHHYTDVPKTVFETKLARYVMAERMRVEEYTLNAVVFETDIRAIAESACEELASNDLISPEEVQYICVAVTDGVSQLLHRCGHFVVDKMAPLSSFKFRGYKMLEPRFCKKLPINRKGNVVATKAAADAANVWTDGVTLKLPHQEVLTAEQTRSMEMEARVFRATIGKAHRRQGRVSLPSSSDSSDATPPVHGPDPEKEGPQQPTTSRGLRFGCDSAKDTSASRFLCDDTSKPCRLIVAARPPFKIFL